MEMKPVEGSSTIHSIGYDQPTQLLRVQFKDKHGTISALWEYANVDPATAAALRGAPSVGSFLQTVIKREPARFPAVRIEEAAPMEIQQTAMPTSGLRHTRTFVEMDVPAEFHAYVKERLLAAGYDHAIDGDTLDMHGIALVLPS